MDDQVAALQMSNMEKSLRNAIDIACALTEWACVCWGGEVEAVSYAVLTQNVIHLEFVCEETTWHFIWSAYATNRRDKA